MVVRILLRLPARSGVAVRNRHSALAIASLMAPLSLMAWTLGVWRLASDMKWASSFAISQGLFSHWQVWFAVGIGVQFGAFLLGRLAFRGEDTDDPALS